MFSAGQADPPRDDCEKRSPPHPSATFPVGKGRSLPRLAFVIWANAQTPLRGPGFHKPSPQNLTLCLALHMDWLGDCANSRLREGCRELEPSCTLSEYNTFRWSCFAPQVLILLSPLTLYDMARSWWAVGLDESLPLIPLVLVPTQVLVRVEKGVAALLGVIKRLWCL